MTAQASLDLGLDLGLMLTAPPRNTTTFIDNMSLPVHRWFRYSAGFSADWVASLLKDTPDARVLDPFAGSGTTLIAAQQSGAQSFGIDSQDFISRVAQAKLCWTADAKVFLERGRQMMERHVPAGPVGQLPPLLAKCYTEDALDDLIGLRNCLEDEPENDPISRLLWLAVVSIIRKTSHVGTAQWQYVLPNKSKRTTLGVLQAFELQLNVMAVDMKVVQSAIPAPVRAEYVENDARVVGVAPSGWATHVICSPPYANNYDYADVTRLEQTVMGEVSSWGDLKPMRSKLIRSCSQAMTRYQPAEAFADPILDPIIDELREVHSKLDLVKQEHGGKKAYDSMIVAYFHDMAHVWRALRDATAEEAKICFVIGDSAPYGVYVPVERWLGQLAVSQGFESWSFEKVRDRNIKWKNRKHDVPLHEGRLWVVS